MGYLTGITGLIASLGVPLPVMPGAANPAAAAAAGAAATGMSLGLQGAGAALSGAAQAGTHHWPRQGGSPRASAGGDGRQRRRARAHKPDSQASPASPRRHGFPRRAGRTTGRPTQALQSAQGMMGPMMSAPSMAASSMGQLLSQAQQLPSSDGRPLSAACCRRHCRRPAAVSAAAATPGLGVSGLGGAGAPWSGSVAVPAGSPGADPR